METLKENDKDGCYVLYHNNNNKFESLWLIPSIGNMVFVNNLNATIIVDACHTCYKHLRIVVAVMQDGNGKLQLIGAGLCFEETKENYSKFFHLLDKHVVKGSNLTIMSDRAMAIEAASEDVFKERVQHFACMKHLHSNVDAWANEYGIDRDKVWATIKKMITTTNQDDFNEYQGLLQAMYSPIYQKLQDVKQVWTRIQLREHLFGVLTSNAAEIINGVMKRPVNYKVCIRDSHIIHMTIGLYVIMKTQMENRREVILTSIEKYHNEDIISDYAMKKITSYKKSFNGIQWKIDSDGLIHYDNHNYLVNLQEKTCTCNLYQEYGYPCIHAYALIRLKKGDFNNTMVEYVHEHYLLSTIKKTCGLKLANPPIVSVEELGFFSAYFDEDKCSAVINTSPKHKYNASYVEELCERVRSHIEEEEKSKVRKSERIKEKTQQRKVEGQKKSVKRDGTKSDKRKSKRSKVNENDMDIDDEEYVEKNKRPSNIQSDYDLRRTRLTHRKGVKKSKNIHSLSQGANQREL